MYFHFQCGKAKFLLILNRHDENLHIFVDSFIFVTGYLFWTYTSTLAITTFHFIQFQFSINHKIWKKY